ncbi:MAG: cell division protein ZapA [Oscillospiraceae bacterium]|nr:cell division protein ZapA [Oscillospiraceae bacterium]
MIQTIRFKICGEEYVIKSEENPAYIIALARRLEVKINEIVDKYRLSQHKSAIMIGHALLADLDMANKDIDNLRKQIKGYVHEAGKAKNERDDAVRELDSVKAELEMLKQSQELRSFADTL